MISQQRRILAEICPSNMACKAQKSQFLFSSDVVLLFVRLSFTAVRTVSKVFLSDPLVRFGVPANFFFRAAALHPGGFGLVPPRPALLNPSLRKPEPLFRLAPFSCLDSIGFRKLSIFFHPSIYRSTPMTFSHFDLFPCTPHFFPKSTFLFPGLNSSLGLKVVNRSVS